MATLSPTLAAKLIEEVSAQMCHDHHDMWPQDEWGGHNDDRLTAIVRKDISIEITDNNGNSDIYTGLMEDESIRAYVHDWLTEVWM